ncbi:MAG TPA: metalloregulator ArsR/SmtB family transcription factor [Myxococcota bacterium]|nr:metalloregulator ArsR/SmtB family transcription factor [Myxococcota bacterium]HQK51694.1 metalloregulator ArsR/SmtB family transcription factor [Myxococcota bacterium]
MGDQARTAQVTAMAALLSAPIRCAILQALRSGPRIVGDLVEALGESQATVSKQIAILREAGVLVCRPDGRCREYSLVDPDLVGAILDGLEALGESAARQAAECRARRASRIGM